MDHDTSLQFLAQASVLLAALALAAPIARRFNAAAVLGYLVAGILIGPSALGRLHTLYPVEAILSIANFGVVLLLFLIGLETRPKRVMAMRASVFGAGAAQMVGTGLVLGLIALAMTSGWSQALFVGLALAISSTALTLQVLEERGEIASDHGRLAFAIMLFQDLASIVLIALVPLFAVRGAGTQMGVSPLALLKAALAIAGVIVVGRLLLPRLYRLAAGSGVREAASATAFLTVIGVALAMEAVGLSAALGAFIAGALLAETEFRHDIEANIAPFQGLLLGIFFTAIGMGLDLGLLFERPVLILSLLVMVLAIKSLVLYGVGLGAGLGHSGAKRLALAASQVGEFAFVLFAAASQGAVIGKPLADLLAVVATLSMIATPILIGLDSLLTRRTAPEQRAFDTLPEREGGHVIIAGFGRFGQIVARVLAARRIPFIALDKNIEQVDFVRRFGSEVYFGDATRIQLLEAARAHEARAFVLAIDDVEESIATAELVRRRFPGLVIYARARNRRHAHRLMDLGVELIRRETFLSALEMTEMLLRGLGLSAAEATRTVVAFRDHDRRRLYEDWRHYTDVEKMQELAKDYARELQEQFEADASEPKARSAPAPSPQPVLPIAHEH